MIELFTYLLIGSVIAYGVFTILVELEAVVVVEVSVRPVPVPSLLLLYPRENCR